MVPVDFHDNFDYITSIRIIESKERFTPRIYS